MSDDVDSLAKWLEASEAIHNTRHAAPYDGVLGSLPGWIPEWHRKRFMNIRNCLLDAKLFGETLTPEQIIKWIDAYCRLGEAEWEEYIPKGIFKEIGELAHYRWISSLEKQRGLAELDSKAAPFSKGGTNKKGKFQEPKTSISAIIEKIGSRSFSDVLAVLRDAEQCADLYESTQAPIGVLFGDVDDDNETIEYLKRGELPDNPKTITFRTLRNILSQLK